MTRHILILHVLLLTLLVGCVSDSVNYQKGWDAAQKGDFATALREWKPLAEQGGAIDPPPLSWSTLIVSKGGPNNGYQETSSGRNRYKIAPG
jgi:hypothetical protein